MAEININRDLFAQMTEDLSVLHSFAVLRRDECCDKGECATALRVARAKSLLFRTPHE